MPPGLQPVANDTAELKALLEKLYQEHGADFRQYNKATLARRLSKRLQARKVQTYADYVLILDQDPGEYEKLLDVCTVNQTSFFRNPAVYEVVRKILAALIERCTRENGSLRIWSAGCSTGQEPYSLAMVLAELLAGRDASLKVEIIASDIDSKVLAYAREGIYTLSEAEQVPEPLREKYLRLEKGKYHCRAELKQMMTFAQHSITAEPPFGGIDLLVCRNVIIYFMMPLQMQVFRAFHQSLKPNGLLLLGDSEIPMREARGLFTCLDSGAKLYRKTTPHRADYRL